jgi:hypothetical protein
VFIENQPEEKKAKGGIYLNFTGIGKNPYAKGRKYYRISIWVPTDKADPARKVLTKGKTIWLRHAEVDGNKNPESGVVFMQITSKWPWVEPLTQTMDGERR